MLHEKTQAAIAAICAAIDADPLNAGGELLAAVHKAVGFDTSPGMEMSQRFKVAERLNRALGSIATFLDVATRVERIARKKSEEGAADVAEAFMTLVKNLNLKAAERAEVWGADVAKIRAEVLKK